MLCCVVLPCGPEPCLGKGPHKVLTGAAERCITSALSGLPSPAQRCVQLLALLSSGEREIHPNAPEVGCEETTALLLLLSPGMSFPLGVPRVRPGLRFALDAQGATSCVSCHRRSGLSWCVFAGGIPNELVKLSSRSLPPRSLSAQGDT